MYKTRVDNNTIYISPQDRGPKKKREQVAELVEMGGHYNRNTSEVEFPFNDDNVKKLHSIGAINKYTYVNKQYPIKPLKRYRVPHLRDYQISPLEFAIAHGGRMLLADDVGLGKTITASSYFLYTKIHYPLLIICQASTKTQWEREFTRFDTDNKKVVVCDRVDSIHAYDADVIIANYELFSLNTEKRGRRYYYSQGIEELKNMRFQGAIFDECQYLKEETTLWNHSIRYIIKDTPNILALSATPIENKPIEFFNILNILRPDIWHNKKHFALRYCNGHMTSMSYKKNGKWLKREYFDDKGSSNLDELYTLLTRHVMFRRLNHATIAGLPKAVPHVLPLHLSEKDKKQYKDIMEGRADVSTHTRGDVELTNSALRAMQLKEFSANAKLDFVISFLKDFLKSSDEKIIVFTEHHSVIDALYKAFPKVSVKLDGRVSGRKKKDEAKNAFIDDPKIRILFGQFKSAGIGNDGWQYVAHTILYAEFPYVPSTIKQCNGRLERDGSKWDTVNVYFPVLLSTIEEEVIDMLVNKQNDILAVMDNETDIMHITRQVQSILKEKGLDNL